mgnify:CR=1 FL=1
MVGLASHVDLPAEILAEKDALYLRPAQAGSFLDQFNRCTRFVGRFHGGDRICSPFAMGDMLFANIDDGYLEGLLRGYRGGILTSADYANLCQCETIDGAPRAKLRNSRPYFRGRRRARAIALCGPAAAGPLVSSAPFPLCGPALSPPRAPFPPQT